MVHVRTDGIWTIGPPMDHWSTYGPLVHLWTPYRWTDGQPKVHLWSGDRRRACAFGLARSALHWLNRAHSGYLGKFAEIPKTDPPTMDLAKHAGFPTTKYPNIMFWQFCLFGAPGPPQPIGGPKVHVMTGHHVMTSPCDDRSM